MRFEVQIEGCRYTTIGRVTGGCDHEHRSIETAYRCWQRHSRGCHKQGGFSDREIYEYERGNMPDPRISYWYLLYGAVENEASITYFKLVDGA